MYLSANFSLIVQELYESQGSHPGLSVLKSLMVSVDNIEPCSHIGLSLSLCQPTSEDIKHHLKEGANLRIYTEILHIFLRVISVIISQMVNITAFVLLPLLWPGYSSAANAAASSSLTSAVQWQQLPIITLSIRQCLNMWHIMLHDIRLVTY